MNSKHVILLGLLASLLLISLCIFFNAERYYKELGLGNDTHKVEALEESNISNAETKQPIVDENETIVETKEEDIVELISTVENNEENSYFNYYLDSNRCYISGEIPLLDNGDEFKQIISDCSKDKLCENNVTFLDNNEEISWKELVLSVLTFFNNEKVLNPKLEIKKKEIMLGGEFIDKKSKEKLTLLIEPYKSTYIISNKTTIKIEPTVSESNETIDDSNQSKSQQKEPNDNNEVKLEEEIASLLKEKKINFKRNSGKIEKEGKKVLDEIVELLKDKDNIFIEIQGHTDAGGKEKVNLWISQVRADGVKKYLIKKGIASNRITAKGFGEKKLLLPETPYDPSNRRVEIHLKRK
jgi:outer membrane protein OmpA-like peptidoglycan-associated protein